MTTNKKIHVSPPTGSVRGTVCFGGICFEWPDPLCGFKPQRRGWHRPKFPVVMLAGNFGRQLVYEDVTQNTFFENEPPVFWLYPDTGKYPFAGMEQVCEGFEDRVVYNFANKYNRMVYEGVVPPPQFDVPASEVRINDIYGGPDEDAFTRIVNLTQLQNQPEGVTVAKAYQANDDDSFNTYLKQFKDEGFKGAWVRPNESVWGDIEFFVTEEL